MKWCDGIRARPFFWFKTDTEKVKKREYMLGFQMLFVNGQGDDFHFFIFLLMDFITATRIL